MRLLQFAFIGVILLVGGVNVRAETITQREFLRQLIDSHPLFVKEKLTMEILTEERKGLKSINDWNFNSTAVYNHDEPAFAFTGPEKTDAFQLSGSVNKLNWNNGSVLSASFATTRVDLKIDPFYGVPDNYYENILAVSYSLPLKKNKGGLLNRLAYDLKKYDIDISDLISLENQENFLEIYSLKFLEWVFLLEQKSIIQQRLELSKELLHNTQEKRDANLIDEVDVIRANDAVLIAQQNLMLVDTKIGGIKSELAEITQDSRYLYLSPVFDLYQFDDLKSIDESVQELHDNARMLKYLSIRIDQLRYFQKGNKEQTKPDLSFFTELSVTDADKGIGNSLVMDKPSVMVGLKYAFPFGHKEAKSNMVKTELQVDQLIKEKEEISLNLTSSLVSVHQQLSQLNKVLELNVLQIESAKKKTDEEMKLYNQGRGQMTFVIQSRDSEEAAKLTYAENAFQYHKLSLLLLEITDQLYQKSGELGVQ